MQSDDLLVRVALGAVAGAAATMALQQLMAADKAAMPQAQPPIREEPGKFILQQAEAQLPPKAQDAITGPMEDAAAKVLGLGYGMTLGAVYGAVRANGGSIVVDGALLGLATWAVGYLGWMPASGLMPNVTKQTPQQVALPIVEHVFFGITTVAAYDGLRHAV